MEPGGIPFNFVVFVASMIVVTASVWFLVRCFSRSSGADKK